MNVSSIVRVEVGRFDYAFAGEFKFFEPGPDGVIVRPTVLVRLTDEDGRTGWGQAVPVPSWTYETAESVVSTLIHYIAPKLIGADPADFENIHQRMDRVIRPGFTTGQPLCKAAVDLACYDLAGKQRGVSAAHFLGGGGLAQPLRLSWTVASPSMDGVAAQLEEGRDRGYTNFNIKVGAPQTPEYDLELARTVRAFSPDGFLWADANTGFDLAAALELLPAFADLGVDVIESPLPPNRILDYIELRRQGALPIYMDEGIITEVETEAFIRLGMLDGLTIKAARCAGLWHASKIVELAKRYDLPLLGSGLCDPDLSLAASVQLFSAAGIDRPCALNGPQYLADSLDTTGFIPTSDRIRVPAGPGLGLELDERAEAALIDRIEMEIA